MSKTLTPQEMQSILQLCEFPNFKFRVHVRKDGAISHMQIYCDAKDNVTGEPVTWKGRKWKLSPFMTKSEVVQTAFMAVMAAVEHETREQFKFRGESIFDPHYDVERLWELRREVDCLDEREPVE